MFESIASGKGCCTFAALLLLVQDLDLALEGGGGCLEAEACAVEPWADFILSEAGCATLLLLLLAGVDFERTCVWDLVACTAGPMRDWLTVRDTAGLPTLVVLLPTLAVGSLLADTWRS
jgi:hypothetical protein